MTPTELERIEHAASHYSGLAPVKWVIDLIAALREAWAERDRSDARAAFVLDMHPGQYFKYRKQLDEHDAMAAKLASAEKVVEAARELVRRCNDGELSFEYTAALNAVQETLEAHDKEVRLKYWP